MKGVWIKPPTTNASVVFVHGILSDGEACWTNHNGCYWPELLSKEPGLESLGVYVFTYQTGFFSGSYRLSDVVDALNVHMTLDRVLESDQLIFVCHSMGGIVVRKFLVERALDLIEAQKRVALFLVASPTLGSSYADWLSPLARLFGHSQADVLRFVRGNEWLADLNKEFKNLKESGRLPMRGKELTEDKFLVLRGFFFRRQVVEPFAGDVLFGEGYKVPKSDHLSIAKPENSGSIQHRLLCDFIRSFLAIDTDGNAVERGEKPQLSTTSLTPPLEDRRLPPNPSNRFYFGSRQHRFVGRQAEMENLAAFLRSEGDFKWWLLLGPAGSGKSRLALEAYISHEREWTAGFLNKELVDKTNWRSWRPTKPTFIIIDYLPGREEPVHRMLLALSSRREPIRHPIRTLIINRTLDDAIDKVMGIGGDRAIIQSKRFREKPVVLGRLSDTELLAIASESAIKAGRASAGATVVEYLHSAEAATPLLAALVGERDLTSGASRDEFLSDYLYREEQSRWGPANVNQGDKNLCALATMLDGINLEELAALPRKGIDFPTPRNYRPERLSVMTGFKSTDEVKPLSPHLIGEFFVFERLNSLHKIARQALLRLMWRGFPRCQHFIYRCRQDFPHHEMTALISEAPNSSSEEALDYSTLMLFPDFLKCSMEKKSWAKARELLAAIDRVNGEPKTPVPSNDKIRYNWRAQAHLFWAQCEAAEGHPETAVQTVKEWAGHDLDNIPKSGWALEPLFLVPVGEVLQELVKTFAANDRWADSDKAFQSLLFMAEQSDVLDPAVCLTKCTIQGAFALENIAQAKSASQRYERLKRLEASVDKKIWLFPPNEENLKRETSEFHARLELSVTLAAKSVVALAGNENVSPKSICRSARRPKAQDVWQIVLGTNRLGICSIPNYFRPCATNAGRRQGSGAWDHNFKNLVRANEGVERAP